MKKQFVIALALLMGTFSFAQKKELKTAEKAIKNSNFAEAKTALGSVTSMLSSLDGKTKDKYYYLNAQALYANGTGSNDDIDSALESLANINTPIVGATELKQSMVNSFLTVGNEAYESKDFAKSSDYFERAYRVSTKDTLYLYYAASMSVSVQDFDRSLELYNELKDIGFTGVETKYSAINKETSNEDFFDTKSLRDISVKGGTHVAPTEKKSESKRGEIVKNIALIYVNKGEDEKAIAAMKDARAAYPDDVSLLLSEANVHYKMGNTDEFKKLLEEATAKDPNNPELLYNLGVIAAESGDIAGAKAYYTKSIEIDSNYANSQINMAALILGEEETLIEEMNGLGSSSADDKRYDELKNMRKELYASAIPYLETALNIDTNNIQAAKTLMNIYSITGDDVKFQELKAKVETLESGN